MKNEPITEAEAIKLFLAGEHVRVVEIRNETARAQRQQDKNGVRTAGILELACVCGADAVKVNQWQDKSVDGDKFAAEYKPQYKRGELALLVVQSWETSQYGTRATGSVRKIVPGTGKNPA